MPKRDRLRRPSIFSDLNPVPNSLFGEILDWLLAPLLLLWPISIAATYHVALRIADEAYDPALADRLEQIASAVRLEGREEGFVRLPPPPPLTPNALEAGRQAVQLARLDGTVLWGNEEIPLPRLPLRTPFDKVQFRNDAIAGEEVRIAHRLLPAADDARPLIVQVAETRMQRRQLSSHIISGVLLPQFVIIPLAVALVWLGLTRGLLPLKRLQERIRSRRPDDLSPIDLATVPEELAPMIAAFNDMMARLSANLDAQQRFIAAAAHQLKTPLTGLKTQIELALAEPGDGQWRDYLRRIAAGVDRAAHLTNQLLRLARVEASQMRSQPREVVELSKLAREVLADFVPQAMARGIDLGFEGDGQAKIQGVPLLLREMIANLVDNAIKYTPRGGAVTVRLMSSPTIALEVADNGIGIPEGERAHIFERFYRVLGTGQEGSGLGLAIVREIADIHHVEIEVKDNPDGKGSCFRLSFPAIARC